MRNLGVVLVCLLAACGDDGGDGDSDDGPACSDPKYGNGTCDLDTSCDMVDVDCVETFATQAEAQDWFEASHGDIPTLPATDPLYARVKPLLDDGWDAYRATHDVGDLADAEVQLVIVNPPQINLVAFVSSFDPAGSKAALAVMVERVGLQGALTDDEVFAIMMHELEHAIGLHVVRGVKEEFNTFYVAPGTSEPFGHAAADDAMVRADFDAWNNFAVIAGHWSDTQLVGLPMGVLERALSAWTQTLTSPLTAPCQTAIQNVGAAYNAIYGSINKLDVSVTLTQTDADQILMRFTAVRDQCISSTTKDVFDFVSEVSGYSVAALKASLPATLVADLEGINPVVGFYNWALNARTLMRDVEARFAARTGQPWSRLRYFSTEEAADDSAAVTMKALGIDGNIGVALSKIEQFEATCAPLIANNTPLPYGENLADSHHASCWRGGHYKAIQASADNSRQVAPHRVKSPPRPRPILAPPYSRIMN